MTDSTIIYEDGWYKYEIYASQESANRVCERLRKSGFAARVKHTASGGTSTADGSGTSR